MAAKPRARRTRDAEPTPITDPSDAQNATADAQDNTTEGPDREEVAVFIEFETDPSPPHEADATGSTLVSGTPGAAAIEVEAALEIPPNPHVAAFFDVDNTMVIGASIFHFAKGLASRKFLTSRDLSRFVWKQVKFRASGEASDTIAQARESALAFFEGKPVEPFIEMAEEIYDELIAGRIYSGTRALAQLHLDAGERVWLVTATPEELAEIIARRLGLTGALGTRSEVSDGLYTGRLIGDLLHGQAKADVILDLAEREGLDLSQCYAYSDSINDIPMLSLVGHAVAVNPDAALRDEAKRRGWEIRDFRTGRKAARIGIPTALVLGAAGGAVAAGMALGRKQERTRWA